MKIKNCPFCGKEISDEAIICKFCHRLLIDENGNDIQPEAEASVEVQEQTAAPEPVSEPEEKFTEDDDKTIVYSKDELKKALAASAPAEEDPEPEEEYDKPPMQTENDAYIYNESYDDDYEEDDETFAADNSEGYDPKRTFIITAIITGGILIVVIAAVCVGYKLFGFGDDESSSTVKAPPAVSFVHSEAESADSIDVYVPQVTDDTLSEEPEEVTDSELSDPVTENSSAADNTSLTDSAAPTESVPSTDSTASTDSTDESSVSDSTSSTTVSSADGGPGFAPAGSYYSWDEANTIISNYFMSNGMNGSYSYQYGTDGVEMVYGYTDDSGNTVSYRVDLNTGAVSLVG